MLPPVTCPHHHILPDGQFVQGTNDLVGAGQAPAGDLVGRQAGDLLPPENHPPALRRVDAADDVEHRRLARAVGADEPQNLPLRQAETHILESLQAPEPLGDVLYLENHAGLRGSET